MEKNINHKNYHVKRRDGEGNEVKLDADVSEYEEVNAKLDDKTKKMVVELGLCKEEILYGLNKAQQIQILFDLGLTPKEVNKLSLQKQRVDKILEFVRK